MSGVRVYYDWFAGTLSNLLAAGIMDDVDPGLTIGWKDGKQISEKKAGKYFKINGILLPYFFLMLTLQLKNEC
jgi:hypothetical protein